MLRRCALDLSSTGRSTWRYRRTLAARVPFSLSSRSASSSVPKPPQAPFTSNKPSNSSQGRGQGSDESSGSGSVLPKLLLGGIVVGAAVAAANEAGYINITRDLSGIGISSTRTNKQEDDVVKQMEFNPEELREESTESDLTNENSEPVKPVPVEEPEVKAHGSEDELASHGEAVASEERMDPGELQPDQLPPKEVQMPGSYLAAVDSTEIKNNGETTGVYAELKENEKTTEAGIAVSQEEVPPIHEEHATSENVPDHLSSELLPKGPLHPEEEINSLSNDYTLQKQDRYEAPQDEKTLDFPFGLDKEDQTIEVNNTDPENEVGSEKMILDLIQTIHAAEKRQAESDFRVFEEEKKVLKEKYEKELRDARARELMYAEEAALLDKELIKERTKAAATVKTLQEKAEQNLRDELQRKAEETEKEIQKVKELAKAELNAALASEKSSQMEKIAEADLNINALCMAFYARSEEARQNLTVHKLALGTLALEDALAKGLPIRSEVEALKSSLGDIKNDSLLELVLSSLPEEILDQGAITKPQLNQKFDLLKGTLRHFGLIPPGGGGLLTHTIAYVASNIKVKESNVSGDGIESVISRVDSLLAEGRLLEAADALEGGVSGTEAQGVIRDWVIQAKNRAISEQALTLLQSYATSVSLA